jgi:hypothetical protein
LYFNDSFDIAYSNLYWFVSIYIYIKRERGKGVSLCFSYYSANSICPSVCFSHIVALTSTKFGVVIGHLTREVLDTSKCKRIYVSKKILETFKESIFTYLV